MSLHTHACLDTLPHVDQRPGRSHRHTSIPPLLTSSPSLPTECTALCWRKHVAWVPRSVPNSRVVYKTNKMIIIIPKRVWLWDAFSMAMDSCIHTVIDTAISMEVVLQVREVLSHVREHELAGSAQPLQPATVTAVAQLPMGDRVCVDLCSRLSPGEGLLVGNFCRTLFLVHSEVHIHPPPPLPLATQHNATMPAAHAIQSHTPAPVPSSLCRTTVRIHGRVLFRAAVGPEKGGRRAAKARVWPSTAKGESCMLC